MTSQSIKAYVMGEGLQKVLAISALVILYQRTTQPAVKTAGICSSCNTFARFPSNRKNFSNNSRSIASGSLTK